MPENNVSSSYTQEDIKKTDQVNDWVDESEANTHALLCRKSGASSATVSQILNFKYSTSPTKFLDSLLDVISIKLARKKDKVKIPFVETSVSKAITQVCSRARKDQDIGFFAGNVGIGKTEALRRYAKKVPSAVLVEAFEGMDNRTFVFELSLAAGKGHLKGTVSQQIAALIRFFKGTNKVIIADEADHLSQRSLGCLRRIVDVAEVGVVLVGTQELLQMLQDPAGKYGQLSSRVGFWPDVKNSITELDTAVLVESFFGEKVEPDIKQAFLDASEGSARILRTILRNTYRKANNLNEEITPELIKKVNTDTMGGRGFTKRSV